MTPDRLAEDVPSFDFLPDPLASLTHTDGAVRYRLLLDERDDGSRGVIGAAWLALDDRASGIVGHPRGGGVASSRILAWREALAAGFAPVEVYRDSLRAFESSEVMDVGEEAVAGSHAALLAIVRTA